MKFYATIESYTKLKNVFTNLNSFYIIDVDSLLSQVTLDRDSATHRFIINSEIGRLIAIGARSKRYTGILYINSQLNCDSIIGIKHHLASLNASNIEELVLLDDYDTPKMKDYYKLFDEIIFFPSFKKTKIIECKSVVPKKK